MTLYHYFLFPAESVKAILSYPFERDSYLAEEPVVFAVRECLKQGYRWVRTDGDHAVFERQFLDQIPPRVKEMLDANTKTPTTGPG